MRRVLFIHYHFLPLHNVAVKRLVGYIQHLPVFGWDPIVLTRDWSDMCGESPSWGLSWEPSMERDLGLVVRRVPRPRRAHLRLPKSDEPWLIRKTLALAHIFGGSYPDEFIGWAKPAAAAARDLARSEHIDAVITYCPPETNHVIGSRLARAIGVPWIPFFGDLYGFFLAQFRRRSLGTMICRALHHRWIQPAAACVGVSPYMVEYLSQTYNKPVELVLTGYDPQEFPLEQPWAGPRHKRCVVSHIGSLYPGDQRPEIFFDGLDRFLYAYPEAESLLEVRFIGSKCETQLHQILQGRPSERVCTVLPKIESIRAAAMVRESDILLAFNCTKHRDGHGTMSYPTKVFEAFGARRPILAVPSDRDWLDTLLAYTGAGQPADDASGVATVLSKWFTAWRSCGKVPYHARPELLAEFTKARQTKRLADLLDFVHGGNAFTQKERQTYVGQRKGENRHTE